MPKKPTPLHNHISKKDYHLINWKDVSEYELKEAIDNCPNFVEDLALYTNAIDMTEKLWNFALRQSKPSLGEDKIIHFMARQNKLQNLPKPFLTAELLSLKGRKEQTVFHILAINEATKIINQELLTKEILLLKDGSESTPLHSIVLYDTDLVLKRDIGIKELFMRNDLGETPLYNWACGSKWFTIPDKFLTKETLGQTEDGPVPILDILVQQHKRTAPRTITHMFLQHSLEKTYQKIDEDKLRKLEGDIEKAISNPARKELTKRKVFATIKKEEPWGIPSEI